MAPLVIGGENIFQQMNFVSISIDIISTLFISSRPTFPKLIIYSYEFLVLGSIH